MIGRTLLQCHQRTSLENKTFDFLFFDFQFFCIVLVFRLQSGVWSEIRRKYRC